MLEGDAIVWTEARERHHVVRGADHVDAIDLHETKTPDGIAEMADGGTRRTRVGEALGCKRNTARFDQGK